jgi:hypothetical protein
VERDGSYEDAGVGLVGRMCLEIERVDLTRRESFIVPNVDIVRSLYPRP